MTPPDDAPGHITPLHHPGDWDPTWDELLALRRKTEAGLDPEWVDRYGEETFRAALEVYGGLSEYLHLIGEDEDPASQP